MDALKMLLYRLSTRNNWREQCARQDACHLNLCTINKAVLPLCDGPWVVFPECRDLWWNGCLISRPVLTLCRWEREMYAARHRL